MSESVEVIRESFKTVADEFMLTEENCPTHPSFITRSGLAALKARGVKLFGLFDNDLQIGFIAVEKANDGVYYIEKLAVLPRYRHNSHGKQLMQFAFDYVKSGNGRIVSIGIIDRHAVLKEWYRGLGFGEMGTKTIEHLPFTVCFMEKNI